MPDFPNNPIDGVGANIPGVPPQSSEMFSGGTGTAESLIMLQGLIQDAWKLLQTVADNPLTSTIAIKKLGDVYESSVIKRLEKHLSLLREQNRLTSDQERSIRRMADASIDRMNKIFTYTGMTAGIFFKVAQLQEQLEITGARTLSYGAANTFTGTPGGQFIPQLGIGLAQDPYKTQALAIEKIKNTLMWRYNPELAEIGKNIYENSYSFLRKSKTYNTPEKMANFVEAMTPLFWSQGIEPTEFPKLMNQFRGVGGGPAAMSGFLNMFSRLYQEGPLMNLGGNPRDTWQTLKQIVDEFSRSGMSREQGAPILSATKLITGTSQLPNLTLYDVQLLSSLVSQFNNPDAPLARMMAMRKYYGGKRGIEGQGEYLTTLARERPMELIKDVAEYIQTYGKKDPGLITEMRARGFVGLGSARISEITTLLKGLDTKKLEEINKLLKDQIWEWDDLGKHAIKTVNDIPKKVKEATDPLSTMFTYLQAAMHSLGLVSEQILPKELGYTLGAGALGLGGLGALILGKYARTNPIGAVLGYDVLKQTLSHKDQGGGGGFGSGLLDAFFLSRALKQGKLDPIKIPSSTPTGPVLLDQYERPISTMGGGVAGGLAGRFAGFGDKVTKVGKSIGYISAALDGISLLSNAIEKKDISGKTLNLAGDALAIYGGIPGLIASAAIHLITASTEAGIEQEKSHKLLTDTTKKIMVSEIFSNVDENKKKEFQKFLTIESWKEGVKGSPDLGEVLGRQVYKRDLKSGLDISKSPFYKDLYSSEISLPKLQKYTEALPDVTKKAISAGLQSKLGTEGENLETSANTSNVFIHIVDDKNNVLAEKIIKQGQQATLYVSLAGITKVG